MVRQLIFFDKSLRVLLGTGIPFAVERGDHGSLFDNLNLGRIGLNFVVGMI